MLSYWIWLFVYVFAPMAAALVWKGEKILKYKKTIILCGIGSLIFAVPWDNFAIKTGVWGFPAEEILGIWFLGLPIEEWFFIFFVGVEASMLLIALLGEKIA